MKRKREGRKENEKGKKMERKGGRKENERER